MEVKQSTIDTVRSLVGAPPEKAGLITSLCQLAMADFMDACHRDDVPDAADSLIADMAVVRYNQMGTEGISSQSAGGVSESMTEDYPARITKRFSRWRKGRFL